MVSAVLVVDSWIYYLICDWLAMQFEDCLYHLCFAVQFGIYSTSQMSAFCNLIIFELIPLSPVLFMKMLNKSNHNTCNP